MNIDQYEIRREKFRPSKIRVLFIGESRPANGTFFFSGDSRLAKFTREAFYPEDGKIPEMQCFLQKFYSLGCFLVDLCPNPVNHLPKRERKRARREAELELAETIKTTQPVAIVVVMIGIANSVKQAAVITGANSTPRYVLPFSAQGHERQYVAKLRNIVTQFKQSGVLSNAR